MLPLWTKLVPTKLLNHEYQRLTCLKKCPDGPLKEYLSEPFPTREQKMESVGIVALDFETTGLDPLRDQLLSIGCVDLVQGKIALRTSHHQVIRTVGQLQASNVAIHHITDAEKERGKELKAAVDHLLLLMKGKILLVHYARIEREFLKEACRQLYGISPPFPMIDTLALCKSRLDKSNARYSPSALRLGNLRSSYRLPRYQAHNALTDSIATAELLLAELSCKYQGLQTRLSVLL